MGVLVAGNIVASDPKGYSQCTSEDMQRWSTDVLDYVYSFWIPQGMTPKLRCIASVDFDEVGTIVKTSYANCNSDDALIQSIEAALKQAKAVPLPENPACFRHSALLEFQYPRKD